MRSQRALQLLERRPPALPAHGGRPARDLAGRRRLGRRLPRGGATSASWCQRSVETGFGHMVSHAAAGRRPTCSRPRRARPGASASTSAASSGSWSTCWRTPPTTAAAPPRLRVGVRARTAHGRGDGRGRRPGHRPARAPQVFERFYRGSASGRRGTGTGTGLGLALVAEHMRVMHGARPGRVRREGGARFVLTCRLEDDGDEPVTGEDEAMADGDASCCCSLRRSLAVVAAGCAIPDAERAQHHGAVQGAVRPPRPAPAHDHDHLAPKPSSLRAGPGLLRQRRQRS